MVRPYRPKPNTIPELEKITAKSWWRVEEVQELFQVCRATVYNWAMVNEWVYVNGRIKAESIACTFYPKEVLEIVAYYKKMSEIV